MSNDVSVVIPVYNGQAFIGRAIESILRQTHPANEIIVVNDGSQDRTLEVVEGFGGCVKVITTPNRGVSSARNTGISACTSTFIAFLDADDEWSNNKIERQMQFLAKHPDVGLCCCDYLVDDGRALRSHFSFVEQENQCPVADWNKQGLSILAKGNFIGTASAVIVRRSLLETVGGFDSRFKQAEDYDLWMRCALASKIGVVPEVLLRKIGHENNLTNNRIEMFQYHEAVLSMHICSSAFRACPGIEHDALLGLAQTRYQIANLFFESGHYMESLTYYLKGLKTTRSRKNIALFSYYAARKIVRMTSFGRIRARTV